MSTRIDTEELIGKNSLKSMTEGTGEIVLYLTVQNCKYVNLSEDDSSVVETTYLLVYSNSVTARSFFVEGSLPASG